VGDLVSKQIETMTQKTIDTNRTGGTERAVSSVLGVILMVAMTVIVAAVIGTVIVDVGEQVEDEAQAGVTLETDDAHEELEVEITTLGNADFVVLGGDATTLDGDPYDGDHDDPLDREQLGVGTSLTIELDTNNGIDRDNGTVTAIAVIEDDEIATQVGSESWDAS